MFGAKITFQRLLFCFPSALYIDIVYIYYINGGNLWSQKHRRKKHSLNAVCKLKRRYRSFPDHSAIIFSNLRSKIIYIIHFQREFIYIE